MPNPPQPNPKHENSIARAVLQWIKGLRAEIAISDIETSLTTGSATTILNALNRAKQLVLNLMPVATEAGEQAINDINGAARLGLIFNAYDPRFEMMIQQLGANAVRDITVETQTAIKNVVIQAYRQGIHPKLVAPTIAETIGLTRRDSGAVLRSYNNMIEHGMNPDTAQAKADRYAAKLRKQRAIIVGVTESIQGHNAARREAWLQAQRNGLFAGKRPMEEWLSVQTDPREICFQMNGRRTPLGSNFDGLYPGFVHPRCRCTSIVVLE